MLRDTNLYEQLIQIAVHGNNKYVIYGDPAYPMSELILKPYTNRNQTPEQLLKKQWVQNDNPTNGVSESDIGICIFGLKKKPKIITARNW